MRIIGIIPARFASSRFPGKPLAMIAGRFLIERVIQRCSESSLLSEVIVATDDQRIANVASRYCRVAMTRSDHPSGSDRIAEVTAKLECDGIVNIQGDEPLIEPKVIDLVASGLREFPMTTAATPLVHESDYENPNVVKVVVNLAGRALYFSRRTIPYLRDSADGSVATQIRSFPFLKHLGIYGFRRDTLLSLVSFPVSRLEAAERLEQLRALDHGIEIGVIQTEFESIGVDTPEDVGKAEALLTARGMV